MMLINYLLASWHGLFAAYCTYCLLLSPLCVVRHEPRKKDCSHQRSERYILGSTRSRSGWKDPILPTYLPYVRTHSPVRVRLFGYRKECLAEKRHPNSAAKGESGLARAQGLGLLLRTLSVTTAVRTSTVPCKYKYRTVPGVLLCSTYVDQFKFGSKNRWMEPRELLNVQSTVMKKNYY